MSNVNNHILVGLFCIPCNDSAYQNTVKVTWLGPWGSSAAWGCRWSSRRRTGWRRLPWQWCCSTWSRRKVRRFFRSSATGFFDRLYLFYLSLMAETSAINCVIRFSLKPLKTLTFIGRSLNLLAWYANLWQKQTKKQRFMLSRKGFLGTNTPTLYGHLGNTAVNVL
jgi:hypothetical protein